MAYTPINWQTGDTITAEKMNKMDNGWGVQATEISETVVTFAPPFPGAIAEGFLEYATPINSSTLSVSLNGTTYTLPGTAYDSGYYYGDYDPSLDDFDFTTYPLCILSQSDGSNGLYTETSGSYSISFSVQTLTVGDDFKSAVELAGESFATLIVEEGVTTWQQAVDALNEGHRVVKSSSDGATTSQLQAVFASTADYSVGFVGIQSINAQTPTVYWLRANSASDVLV